MAAMLRRDFLVATLLAPGVASTQERRPIRVVVPVPAGGSFDATARAIARYWQARGPTIVVENKPGAGTLLGADAVARAPADGNTLFYGSGALVIAPMLQSSGFKVDSLVPVIQVATETFGLVSRNGSGIDSLDDLLRAAAAREAGINCIAVPGAPEIACEQLRLHLKGRSVSVPYPGVAPATAALLGGHGDVMFVSMVTGAPMVRSGQLRLLAASGPAGIPDGMAPVPLLPRVWDGFVLESFSGFFAPRGTPPDRVQELNREIDAVLREPELRALMEAGGQSVVAGPPQVLAAQMRTTQQRYRDLVARLKLTPAN